MIVRVSVNALVQQSIQRVLKSQDAIMACSCAPRHDQPVFDFWLQNLIKCGFLGEYKRLRGLSNLLKVNEFNNR